MFLFVDTTEKITLGLMNEKMEWIEFISEDKSKISAQIHMYIYELCKKHNCNLNEIDAVLYCAGPGSYTGMRVSEGLSDILHWHETKVYTFYHFEVPTLLGIESGSWISEAFKGEYFVYSWSASKKVRELIKKEEFDLKEIDNIYAKNSLTLDSISEFTDDMIKERSSELFPHILKREKREDILYYRKLEEEFKRQ